MTFKILTICKYSYFVRNVLEAGDDLSITAKDYASSKSAESSLNSLHDTLQSQKMEFQTKNKENTIVIRLVV